MKRCDTLTALGVSLLFSVLALSQSGPKASGPAFEAADVHSANLSGRTNSLNDAPYQHVTDNRFEIRNAAMLDLIAMAWSMDEDKIPAGPNWLEWDRYDIIARVPGDTTAVKLPAPTATWEDIQAGQRTIQPDTPQQTRERLMLRALLAERFGLVVHNDTRPIPVFALTTTGRSKLTQSAAAGDAGCKSAPEKADPANGVSAKTVYTCQKMSMHDFATWLSGSNIFALYDADSDVVDRTGLTGLWDLSFKVSGFRETAPDRITVFEALNKIGLNLETAKEPTSVLVVDRVNETPTANLPGVADSLARKVPTEFDVASLKPSDSKAQGARFAFTAGGVLSVENVPLQALLVLALNTEATMREFGVYCNTCGAGGLAASRIVGAPSWMATTKFDIMAKAPAEAAWTSATLDHDDLDAGRLMLRNLLIQRFKITSHTEMRDIPGFRLVAVKPKMKKADPAERIRIFEGTGPSGKDPRLAGFLQRDRLLTVQNMTMDQFAAKLNSTAGNYIFGKPVRNATGLDGAWDFTLSFSGPAVVAQASAAQGASGAGADPTGAISLSDALKQQLGLKLEEDNEPGKVLVIDHIEQTPVGN